MLNGLFVNNYRSFGPEARPRQFARIMFVWAIVESILSVAMIVSGTGAWWHWLGFLTWILAGIVYKLYKNHIGYGMTKLQFSTYQALLELTPPTREKAGLTRDMILAISDDDCIAVRNRLWQLKKAERENIKVANNYNNPTDLLTARIEAATLEVQQSTVTMRELMYDDRDDIDQALAKSGPVSKA